jgi:hypothetical protein
MLRLDPEGIHLTDARTLYGVYADDALEKMIARWDYNRDLQDWPTAHLHVGGESNVLQELHVQLPDVKSEVARHHFPVGGKRFLPCLEDVVEYVILEGLAAPRASWQDAVEEHRADFHRIQLKAAVRRDPDAATEALREIGDS